MCEADFPTEPEWDATGWRQVHPAGRELTEFLRTLLLDRTTEMTQAWNNDDYGCSFNCEWDRVPINVLVMRVMDHWLIICSNLSLLLRFLRPRRYAAALSAMCYHLGRAVRSDSRFRDVRWFTYEEYERAERARWRR